MCFNIHTAIIISSEWSSVVLKRVLQVALITTLVVFYNKHNYKKDIY